MSFEPKTWGVYTWDNNKTYSENLADAASANALIQTADLQRLENAIQDISLGDIQTKITKMAFAGTIDENLQLVQAKLTFDESENANGQISDMLDLLWLYFMKIDQTLVSFDNRISALEDPPVDV